MAGGSGGKTRLATAAGNGVTDAVEQTRFASVIESHLRTLYVYGTFGGANVAFQISPDNVNFFNVDNADLIITATALNVEFRAKFVRLEITGGSGEAIDAILL